MTHNELKVKIAESNNKEWFSKKVFTLNYPTVNFEGKFDGVAAFYKFLEQQIKGFESYGESLPLKFQELKDKYVNTRNQIIRLISNSTIGYEWDSVNSQIQSNNNEKFLYNSPETKFLVELNKIKPSSFDGAYNYLVGNSLSHFQNKNFLNGCFLAFQFENKDVLKVSESTEYSEEFLKNIRKDFTNYINESETHLSEYLSTSYEKVNESTRKITDLIRQKDKNYQEWFEGTSNEYQEFKSSSTKNLTDLEELYQQKLKLEAPAKYWNNRAKKLRTEGHWWFGGLIVALTIAIVVLIWVLNKISDGTIEKLFQNTGLAIKWSIVLITVISFLAFAIRIFSKLTFSSFHLVRDAEEREQLTYVFLALQKEKAIDTTERHLIMQSIFSRADSGLLKDDASPTMPGSIVENIIKGGK